jgi:hypothetical protein
MLSFTESVPSQSSNSRTDYTNSSSITVHQSHNRKSELCDSVTFVSRKSRNLFKSRAFPTQRRTQTPPLVCDWQWHSQYTYTHSTTGSTVYKPIFRQKIVDAGSIQLVLYAKNESGWRKVKKNIQCILVHFLRTEHEWRRVCADYSTVASEWNRSNNYHWVVMMLLWTSFFQHNSSRKQKTKTKPSIYCNSNKVIKRKTEQRSRAIDYNKYLFKWY